MKRLKGSNIVILALLLLSPLVSVNALKDDGYIEKHHRVGLYLL